MKKFIFSLVLSLFSLTACGGGGSSQADSTDPVAATGSVTLPANFSLTLNDVKVHGLLGESAVQSDGSYSVMEPCASPAMITLTDASGNLIFFRLC